MPKAERQLIFDVPIDVLYGVIVDYSRYPEFLKEMEVVDVLERRENTLKIHYTINIIKRINYIIECEEVPNQIVRWRLLKSRWLKKSDGSWLLKDLGDGRTHVTYTIEVIPKVIVPKKVANFLQNQMLNTTLEAFQKRAKSMLP